MQRVGSDGDPGLLEGDALVLEPGVRAGTDASLKRPGS